MSKSDDIKRNSTKIWLAGLGVYASSESSDSKEFEAFVEKGRRFEEKNASRNASSDSKLNELKSRANQTLDRIERAFDMRVSSALKRLGISQKTDLDRLNDKIDTLTVALELANEKLDEKNAKHGAPENNDC